MDGYTRSQPHPAVDDRIARLPSPVLSISIICSAPSFRVHELVRTPPIRPAVHYQSSTGPHILTGISPLQDRPFPPKTHRALRPTANTNSLALLVPLVSSRAFGLRC